MAKTLILRDVPVYAADWLIRDVVANPKRRGTACYKRFELLASANTVAEAAKLIGKGYRLEIAWCAARGYITLENPASIQVVADDEPNQPDETPAEAVEIPAFLSKKARRAAMAAEANA